MLPIAQSRYSNHLENARSRVTELLHEAAFGEETPLGAPTHALNYETLDNEEVVKFRDNLFVADNLVVAATGVSHDKLKALVEAHVEGGDWKAPASRNTHVELNVSQIAKRDTPATPYARPSPYVGGVAKQREDLHGDVHSGIAFAAPAGAAGKPFAVLKTHLANKFGCDNVTHHRYHSGGLITVFGDAKTIEAAIAEVKAVASGSVDTTAAKNKAALSYYVALEGEKSACTLLNAYLNGDGDVRSVSKDDVVNAAKSVLKSAPSYAVVGDTAAAPTYAQITQWWK